MLSRSVAFKLACVCAVMPPLLMSCTERGTAPSGDGSGGQSVSFTGPYALELSEAYENATSDFVRNALADGVVKDSEYSELQNRVIECWRENGYSDAKVLTDGGLSAEDRTDISDEEEGRIFDRCSTQAGVPEIEGLYWAMRQNPDHVDWPSAERDCLVRAGLLEAGATVEEMNEWYMSGDPASQSRAAYVCSQDALGHLGLQ